VAMIGGTRMAARASVLAAALLLAGTMVAGAEAAAQSQCWDQANGQARDRHAAATSGNDGHDSEDVPTDPSGSVAAPRRSTAAKPAGATTTGGTGTAAGGTSNRPAAAVGLPDC